MSVAYCIRRNGRIFQFPDFAHASWRFGAHPDGTGTSWDDCEAVDVDQPHGLDSRYVSHVAKAVRKRIDKEHEDFADATVGGEHTPGYCKILKHVDGTADVSAAKDATLFQNNGIVHSAGNQTLWCITGAASDPTILLMHPNKQYKGGDITWTGAAQFDASVDMTIVHIDASLTVSGATLLDGSTNIHGPADMSDTQIDGTLTVLDRADFSAIGVSGDSTFTGAVTFNAYVNLEGSVAFGGNVDFSGTNVYDSSVFAVEAGASYTKNHALASNAIQVVVYCCSPAAGPVCSSAWKQSTMDYMTDYVYYGILAQDISVNNLTVKTGASGPILKFNAIGQREVDVSGYCRVIATRMI